MSIIDNDLTDREITEALDFSPNQLTIKTELHKAWELQDDVFCGLCELKAKFDNHLFDHKPGQKAIELELQCLRQNNKYKMAQKKYNDIRRLFGDIRAGKTVLERHREIAQHPKLRSEYTKYDVPELSLEEYESLQFWVGDLAELVNKPIDDHLFGVVDHLREFHRKLSK